MAVYVECTDTYLNSRRNTGIQRVVRNIVNNLGECEGNVHPVVFDHQSQQWSMVPGIPAPYEPTVAERATSNKTVLSEKKQAFLEYRQQVFLATKMLWNALRYFIAALLPFAPWHKFFNNSKHAFGLNYLVVGLARIALFPLRKVKRIASGKTSAVGFEILPGDTLVMLDSSWSNSIWDEVAKLKRKGVNVITVVYDLIPISHGQFCDEGLVRIFKHWFSCAAQLSDSFVCISDFVRGCVQNELNKLGRHNIPVEYFYLGSDLDGIAHDSSISEHVAAVCSDQKKFVLAVGTIEPRKRYDVIFNAFEQYVNAYGCDINLVLVGKIGWKVDGLISKIKSHKLFEKGLFLFNDANDAELDMLYDKCSSLVFASDIEGFGLPLVEARQKGIPVLASDIPVFRELADDGVVFFTAGDARSLKEQLRRLKQGEIVSEVKKMKWLSWKESAQTFISKVHALS